MKYKLAWSALLGLIVSVGSIANAATTREVTHSATGSQYSTVQAAYDASSSGDTVEIIDNSAPFVETVSLSNNGITVKGKDGLNPRPTVQTASDGWHAIIGGGNTNTVENLILVGGNWSGVDATAGSGLLTVRNCQINGGANCGVYAEGQPITLIGCVVSGSAGYGINIINTCNVTLSGCTIKSFVQKGIFVAGTATNAVNLNLTDTIIIVDPATAGADWSMPISNENTMPMNLVMDNCTLVGVPGHNVAMLYVAVAESTFNIKDSIFYFTADNAAQNWAYLAPASFSLASFTEDYNVYQRAVKETAPWVGGTVGSHTITLTSSAPLFVNAAAGDYSLISSSPAATLNSTGTPAYAGALPVTVTVQPTPLPVNQWAKVNIPQVRGAAPTMDGTINAAEWQDAATIVMNHANMLASFGFTGADTNPTDADFSGTYYFLWDSTYLYGATKINDAEVVYVYDQANIDKLNGTDAAQFILCNADAMTGGAGGAGQYIFDFAPGFSDATTKAGVFEHWQGPGSYANTVVKSRLVTGGYELEWKIKWSDLSSHPVTPNIGTKLGFVTLLINKSSGAANDFWFTCDANKIWTDASKWNTFTLTASVPVELSTFTIE